jgi:DNA-binding SARP family transcriptional activator
MLEICLFGRTHLLFEGAPLAFRAPARALTLLAYLLLHRDRPLARDAVAVAFWPDLGESDARARLRTHLHYLIEILPKIDRPWLLADKRTVQWNPAAPVCVDVIEFERLARDPATAAEAVTLYTGDLLAGVDDACFEVPRARLRERQIATLLALIDTHRKLNDGVSALAHAQRLLGIDPWREDCMRALIELRSEAGDRAGAAHAYQRFAQRLKDELGVEPMAETTRAYEAAAASPKAPVTRLQRSAPRTTLAVRAPTRKQDHAVAKAPRF